MPTLTSYDGTEISYDLRGSGPAIIFAAGAFNLRDTLAPLANELATDHTTVVYDRRARGESTDVRPYAIEREIDDLRALIDLVGGRASLFGFSSGAILSLKAAADGAEVDRLFLYEPPFRFDPNEPRPPADLASRLQALLDDGRPDEVVATFQIEGVGLPEQMVAGIRQSPMWPALVSMAQSVVYDATITGELATPTPEMLAIAAPTLVLRGEQTWPFLATAAREFSERMPGASVATVPATADHNVEPIATAHAVRSFPA